MIGRKGEVMTAEQLEELLRDYDMGMKGYAGSILERHAVSLARRVLAAEKLVDDAERFLLAKPGSFADAEYRLDLGISIAAYREASK